MIIFCRMTRLRLKECQSFRFAAMFAQGLIECFDQFVSRFGNLCRFVLLR